MKLWLLAIVAVSCTCFVACGSDVSQTGEGGEGGEGSWGNGGTGNAPVTSTASSTSSSSGQTSSSSSSSGGGSMCDNSGGCQMCQGCAVQQLCQAEANACFGNQTCNTLAMCLGGCGSDMTCQQNCAMTAGQAAVDLYNQVGICVICKSCPNDCASQAGGCPP